MKMGPPNILMDAGGLRLMERAESILFITLHSNIKTVFYGHLGSSPTFSHYIRETAPSTSLHNDQNNHSKIIQF